jgi:hypothetical protein
MSPIPILAAIVITAIAVLLIELANGSQQFDQVTGENVLASGKIQGVAEGISQAEGFGVPGAIPTLANNPGDLVIPNWPGAKMGAGISVFDSVDEGRNRLYHQLQLIVSGQSKVYNLDMTIAEMANKWTATDAGNWARIVSGYLGVSTDTTLRDILTA